MNLKQQLIQTIETRGYVSLNELHQIASDLGHKQSTAERILRKIAEETGYKPIGTERSLLKAIATLTNLSN